MSPSEVADGIREYTGISGASYNLDTIMGAEYTIYDVTGFILGVIVIFLMCGMAVMTTLDICYITIPVFQEKVKEERWDGSSGGSRFRIVTRAATTAVDKSMTSEESALKVYLKSRIIMYCICGVMILIAVRGADTVVPVINTAIKAVIDALNSAVSNTSAIKDAADAITPIPT